MKILGILLDIFIKIAELWWLFLLISGLLGIGLNIYAHELSINKYIVFILFIIAGISYLTVQYVQGKSLSSDVSEKARRQREIKIVEEIEALQSKYDTLISNPEVDELITDLQNTVAEKLRQISDNTIQDSLYNSMLQKQVDKNIYDDMQSEFLQIKKRLVNETGRLNRIGNVNVFLGMSITLCAITFLGYTLMEINSKNWTGIDYIYHFAPRLSFSILIEILAFFFLKLYRKNLDDIKYHNNEKTNIDMRIVSLKTAILFKSDDMIKDIISKLAETDRNAILKKGETTIELEKEKIGLANEKISLAALLKAMGINK